MSRLGHTVRYLLLFGCASTPVKVSKDCGCALRPWVSAIVVAQTEGERQIPFRLPGVFDKNSEGPGGSVPVP